MTRLLALIVCLASLAISSVGCDKQIHEARHAERTRIG